ncbi:hypothetical protein L1049_012495 [Liquidambar formosana]|uniref:RNase H type-1 domain-containing protein n=1 Tax=Liquidambar formosana TaxID=63359 RepID=A0AAP0R2A0_LIQFO
MKIIAWNCRGAGNNRFLMHARELLRHHAPDIFIILEPRMGGNAALVCAQTLGFDGVFHIDPVGYFGGIWLFWNGTETTFNLLHATDQSVHALNLCNKTPTLYVIPWGTFFAFGAWTIWLSRNKCVFNQHPCPIRTQIHTIVSHATEFFHLIQHPLRPIYTRTQQLIHCLPSSDPWVTLNIDGSSLGNPGCAGAGGLIRNSVGVWLKGFYHHIGSTTSVCAELWAIRDGLQLAWSMGHRHVILQLDAQIVISLLTQQMAPTPWHLTLVTDCRSLLQRDWQVQIQHVYREANKCADFLAKYGASQVTNFVILNDPPSDLVAILLWDALGIYPTSM